MTSWQPIEIAPLGVHVLLGWNDVTTKLKCVVAISWRAGEWGVCPDDGIGVHHPPTHWMPLPEPPP